jgi:hypothetical protein
MKEDTRENSFPLEQPELRPLLGEFVIQFEWVMRTLRNTIVIILRKENLNDDVYTDILLHDAQAKSLRDYYIGTVLHFYLRKMKPPYVPIQIPNYPEVKKFVDIIHTKLEEAYGVRNTFLHSPWETYEVMDEEREEAVFTGERYSISKKEGLKSKFETLPSTSVFKEINNHLNKLGNILYTVQLRIEKDEKIVGETELIELKELRFKY